MYKDAAPSFFGDIWYSTAHIDVDPIDRVKNMPLKKPLKSCRETFPEIIGHIIKKIEFRYIPVPEYPFYSMYEGHIMLDGGIDLITAAAFTEVKSSCKNIQYIDVRK